MSLASLQAFKCHLRYKKIEKQIAKTNNNEINEYIDNLRKELENKHD
jgi:hypothetical protein